MRASDVISDSARIPATAALVAMARPSQLLLIAIVYGSGVLLATWRHGGTSIGDVLVGVVLLLPAAVAVHWANEAADVATDALTTRTMFSGGSGASADSSIDPAVLLRWALLVAAGVAAVAVALVVTSQFPTGAGVLLAIGLAGGLAYSVAPVALMRRGVGEPTNAVLGGLLLPLYGVASVRGHVEALDVLAFLPFTFVTLCSVMATAWPDRVADGLTGKLTLQVRLDPGRLRAIYAASAIAWVGLIWVVAGSEAAPFPWATLALLPFVWLGWRWYTRRVSPWPSVAAMVGHVVVMLLVTIAALL
jgi:1,4-dihydroxy-2-naphthoate polyprenyltransferase